MDNQSFFKSLIITLPKWIHQFQKSKHENILYINLDYLFQLLWFLKYHTNTRFQVLIDICGVDHPSQKRRFEIVYNLLRATAKSSNKVLICAKSAKKSLILNVIPNANLEIGNQWMVANIVALNAIFFQNFFYVLFALKWFCQRAYTCSFGIEMVV